MDEVEGSFFNFVEYPSQILAENAHAEHLEAGDEKDGEGEIGGAGVGGGFCWMRVHTVKR